MAKAKDATPEMEEDILSNIPGLDDEEGVVGEENEDIGGELDDGRPLQRTQEELEPDPDDKGKKPVKGQEQELDPNDPRNKQPRYDAKGNVVDAKGNIIAAGGRERRLDEQNKRLKSLVTDGQAQVVKLRGEMGQIAFLNGIPQKYGLTNDEVALGLDMVALFRQDPEKVVTTILAEAASRGVDLNKILGRQGGIDTQAITRMLDQRLAPLQRQETEQRRNAEVEVEANRRYNSFLASYPDAETHQSAIAKLMADKNVGEETAYFMLREFAARNGMDFNSDLGQQIVARSQGQRPNGQQQRQPGQRPMVRGSNLQRQVETRQVAIASPDRSYASIVDEAINEAGIR